MKNIFCVLLILLFSINVLAKDQAKFIRDVDGDTIWVSCNNVTQNIRLIGIDTPESKRNAKAKSDAKKQKVNIEEIVKQGKMAAQHLQTLVKPGDTIYLDYDKVKNDKYGRILAYVYMTNNRMLNNSMLADGYAYPMTIKPNTKFYTQFATTYKQAVKDHKGLWQ